eukprot:11182909-Lingulodinium_polyedra.AAC.1
MATPTICARPFAAAWGTLRWRRTKTARLVGNPQQTQRKTRTAHAGTGLPHDPPLNVCFF